MIATRLFDLLDNYRTSYRWKKDALADKIDGQWIPVSSEEFLNTVDLVSYGLKALGVVPGDKIATLSNNRSEWHFIDMGMMQAGAIHVPVYPTISDTDLKFILEDAEIRFVFVSSADLFKKVEPICNAISRIQGIFSFDPVNGARSWKEITDAGSRNIDPEGLKAIRDSIQPGDLATLLYTSGTTGVPKGVMLSHKNLLSQIVSCNDLAPVDDKSRALSFLPLNHVYERMLSYLYFHKGVSIYYAESIEKVADNLKEVKPHIFGCVPRLFEKVYDRIISKGADLGGVKKKLFFWALDLGLKYEINGANGWWYETQLKLARKLVFSKWQEALGGEVKAAVSGGAALQPRLARVFWAAGIPILEGYGLTETSPVIAVNTLVPGGLCFGTVGKVIPDVTVRIAEDGEILCKGPNVMMGYYKRPDLTAEVIDEEGWFHTGDIGMMEKGVYLKITDRKKEIFKTSGGKYIVPQYIENLLKESRFIEQVMVIGENQKYASALIVPAFPYLKEWCEKHALNFSNNEELVKDAKVVAQLRKEVDEINRQLASYEQIKKIVLLSKEWTIDNGELTPKLSLKRREILKQEEVAISKIYLD